MPNFHVTNNKNEVTEYVHNFSVIGYNNYISGGIDWNKKVVDTPTLTMIGPSQDGAIREIKAMFEHTNATDIHISIYSR